MSARTTGPKLILLALAACLAGAGPASGQAPEAAELAALAKEAIEAQNDVLVSGNADAAFRGRERAARFRDGIQGRIQSMLNRQRALARRGNDYKSHRTEVRVNETKVDGDRATQSVTEHVVLALAPGDGRPAETEYVELHVMEYAKENGQWKLVSDVIPPVPPLHEEVRAPVNVPRATEAPPGVVPDPQIERRRRGTVQPSGGGQESLFLMASFARDAEPARYFAYNADAAVNYALTYWGPYESNYNPSYRVYAENDCTNFTSQALRAGGWAFDTDGDRTASNTWYYGNYTWTTSYSWAGAHNFHHFFNQSGRGWFETYFSSLLKGDLVQADWGPTPDGNISHTMVVTAKDANNTIYLTYHSRNNKNRSITDLMAANPGTNWWALAMAW